MTGGCNDIIYIMNKFRVIKLAGNDILRTIMPLVKNGFSTLTAGRSLSPYVVFEGHISLEL